MGKLKGYLVGLGIVAFVLGGSYLAERPKYEMDAEIVAGIEEAPWTRLVSSSTSIDLTSPVSWFQPPVRHWRVAQPMLADPRFFQLASIHYDEGTNIFVLDVDCEAGSIRAGDADQPESAPPMRNILGEPIQGANGTTFRYLETSIPWPTDALPEYCETDWSKEREALRSLR